MSGIPNKPNKNALGHLDAHDRWEAEDMLIGLGMKYYGLISHTRVVDMYTLKQIYVKAMSTTTGKVDQAALATAAKTQSLNALPPAPPAAEPGTSSAILHESPTARYPFVDPGSANALVIAPPPPFLSAAQPIKQKLAAQAFADLSTGRRGMRVQDIPAGLAALGLSLDAELVPGFKGRSQDMIINMDKWQTVVKRFVAREEAKQDTFVQSVSAPLDDLGACVSKDVSTGNAFREIAGSQFDPRTRTQRRQDFAAVFARYQRKEKMSQGQEDSTRSIADTFLNGPIGRDLFEHEYSWNPEQENDIEYNPNLREAFARDSDEESLDAHDERMFLKALGMKVPNKAPYKESVALRDAVDIQSHPALKQTLAGVKNKLSKDDEKHKQREAARQAERDASSAEGWVRRKGGWVADFGPPKKSKEGLEYLKKVAENDDIAYDELYAEAQRANIGALSSETISMLTERLKVAAASGVVLKNMEVSATPPEGSVSSGSTLDIEGEVEKDTHHKKKHHAKHHHAKHGKTSAAMDSVSVSSSPSSAAAASVSGAESLSSATATTGTASSTSNTSTELTPKSQKRVDNMMSSADKVTVNVQHSWSNAGSKKASGFIKL